MTRQGPLLPPGPPEAFHSSESLLDWMGHQFSEFGDIFSSSIYGVCSYAIRKPEFAYHVLVENWQNYVKGRLIGRAAILLGQGLMVSEGAHWKRQRRTTHPQFAREAMRGLQKLFVGVNAALLDRWRSAAEREEPVNVTRDVSALALETILRFIFGDDYEKVGPEFDLLSHEHRRDVAFARAFRALDRVILPVIARRRQSQPIAQDALGSLLVAYQLQSDGRDDHQLVDEILTLIVAGHETTASTLNWTWYLLSQHPEIERRLWDEIEHIAFSTCEDLPKFIYARQVLEEAMRLYPPGWLLSRTALGDDQLGDYFVPRGTEVYVLPYFIQRNPNIWIEPEKFDPDRFRPEEIKRRHPLAALPFSAGPRNCVGEHFARAEMLIHLVKIAKELRLQYQLSRPLELDAEVNLRCRFDFIMTPTIRTRRVPEAALEKIPA